MTIFEPYAHQVAGHCSILKLDGMVCKPLIPRECEFYQTIYREFPQLIPLTPAFHGSITIRKQIPNNQEDSPISADGLIISRNTSLVHNYLNNSTIPPFIPSNISEYIVLQDLTAGMSKPCAMDMKVGTRQRFTTSTLLGFRLCGMRVFRWSGLYSVDRLFGRGLTPDTVEDAVGAFLFDGERVRTELIPSILEELQRIISVIEDPSSPYRFYTSSLLFIYEGDQAAAAAHPERPLVQLKIIDFAHAVPKSHKDGEGDDGFLFGLRNLVILFQNIAARHDGSSSSSEEDSGSEEEETDNRSNSSNSSSSSPSSSTSSSRWKLERAREREREFIMNGCPIAPLLVTSSPMKGDPY